MGSKTVLEEMQDSFKNPVKKVEKVEESNGSFVTGLIILLIVSLVFGVAIVAKKAADWGAEHQIVKQSVVAQSFKSQLPYRIEKIEPTVIVSPLVEKIDQEDFTPVEQKIIDKWGYRDGIMAIAIFDCGESGLDQYAVSYTGDLGIAQINWAVWGDAVKAMDRTSADLLTDGDFNLDVAYIVWDRGDGEEGNERGTWEAWVGYQNDGYLRCLR